MKNLIRIALFAFVMLGATAVTATTPPGTIAVATDGCSFTVHVQLTQSYPVVGWKIKVFDPENWNDGLTVFKGQSSDASSLDLGPFTLPEGVYNVIVDNEYPPDGSSIVHAFSLSCPAATPTPRPTPRPTSPPATGHPNPTPPPTSTVVDAAATPDGSNALTILAIAALAIVIGAVVISRKES